MADAESAGDEFLPWADESPFARGLDGFLIRADDPTLPDLEVPVTGLVVDGTPVEQLLGEPVMAAVPLLDALGAPVLRDGNRVPRPTTVYDVLARIASRRGVPNPVPVLCHQPHLQPVAVCRVCSVMLQRTGERAPSQLFPACQQRVTDGLQIHTADSRVDVEWRGRTQPAGAVVRRIVRGVTELLVTDHLPEYAPGQVRPGNELWVVAQRFGVAPARGATRFPLSLVEPSADAKARPGRGTRDDTAPLIAVDHAACILCDRCSRGCADVKGYEVIGRTRKGYFTRIGFDLDADMGASLADNSCQSCGECAVWCPTDALTIKTKKELPLNPDVGGTTSGAAPAGARLGPLTADELRGHDLFKHLPRKLLDWLQGGVVRRALGVRRTGAGWEGDVLFREGTYLSSAFLLESGTLRLAIEKPTGAVEFAPARRSWWTRGAGRAVLEQLPADRAAAPGGRPVTVRSEAGLMLTAGNSTLWLTYNPRHPHRFVGESACLSNYPLGQTATAAEPTVVLEVSKPVLLALLRHPETRDAINKSLRETALLDSLHQVLPRGASEQRSRLATELGREAEFLRVAKDQVVYREGEPVTHCAFVRVGFVRLTWGAGADERHDYVGPGGVIGADALPAARAGSPVHRATVTALDSVELMQFPAAGLLDALRAAPPEPSAPAPPPPTPAPAPRPRGSRRPPDPGFFADSLLVLDLNKCTRCDECTKACAAAHDDGETRLIREGLREGHFLVATSCRSCRDPRCMVGCPVDAIHRRGNRLEVRIENHCIGCGVCAENCPYNNIRMINLPDRSRAPRRAITCDLCRNVAGPDDEPSCVYACPHDAAHRMTGAQLAREVAEQSEYERRTQ